MAEGPITQDTYSKLVILENKIVDSSVNLKGEQISEEENDGNDLLKKLHVFSSHSF
jgi:hypothetical protein